MPVIHPSLSTSSSSSMRNEAYSYGYNRWEMELWNQMREEGSQQAHQHQPPPPPHKMPGAWYYEEDAAPSCSPVSDPDDIAQFLNYRASIGVQNVTESVDVPTSEHVAEIVGRQGCKIKALRAKTNTYIKTPIRGEDPIFVVTGRLEDVREAKREIECAADHFTQIRASRRHSQGAHAPGQVTVYVRVPLRVVGLVVGPKGATIKRIQQDTHTYIITPSREREPVFEVTGLPHNVDAARKEIETHIFQRTGNFPETEKDFSQAGISLMVAKQQQAQQLQAQQKAQAMIYRKAVAQYAANSCGGGGGGHGQGLYNQMGSGGCRQDVPFGMDNALGLDALLRSFPSMRNTLTPDSIHGLGHHHHQSHPHHQHPMSGSSCSRMASTAAPGSARPSLGGQPMKDIGTYDYWNNNSINDIMENEILSRKFDALSAWSAVGFDKENKPMMQRQHPHQHQHREESPTDSLMSSLKAGHTANGGFGFLNTIWSDNMNLSPPGSLPSASASPSSSSVCGGGGGGDHTNDHTIVPMMT